MAWVHIPVNQRDGGEAEPDPEHHVPDHEVAHAVAEHAHHESGDCEPQRLLASLLILRDFFTKFLGQDDNSLGQRILIRTSGGDRLSQPVQSLCALFLYKRDVL